MLYIFYLIPMIILFSGYFMYKYPPKKINYFIGFRTKSSMKDEKVWKKSNQYCGIIWLKLGIVLLFISSLIIFLICFNFIKFSENLLLIINMVYIYMLVIVSFIINYKIKNIDKK